MLRSEATVEGQTVMSVTKKVCSYIVTTSLCCSYGSSIRWANFSTNSIVTFRCDGGLILKKVARLVCRAAR